MCQMCLADLPVVVAKQVHLHLLLLLHVWGRRQGGAGLIALKGKEAQLKVDKEQVEMETELSGSAAQLKIYTEYESPQQLPSALHDENEGQHKYETLLPRLAYQKRPVLSTSTSVTKPKKCADQRSLITPAYEPLQQHTDTSELYRVIKR